MTGLNSRDQYISHYCFLGSFLQQIHESPSKAIEVKDLVFGFWVARRELEHSDVRGDACRWPAAQRAQLIRVGSLNT